MYIMVVTMLGFICLHCINRTKRLNESISKVEELNNKLNEQMKKDMCKLLQNIQQILRII